MDFYSISFNKIKEFKPKIKDSSIRSYLLNIKKISKELFKSDKPSILYFIDFLSIHEYINNMKSIASRKNMTTSILVLIKSYSYESNDKPISSDIITMYINYHKELSKEQDNSYLDNIKTEREKDNWISGDDISIKISSLQDSINNDKNKNTRKYVDKVQQHLVLSLYTLLPPLRNDYAIVKILDIVNNSTPKEIDYDTLDMSYNYIDINNNMLLLCKYKTDKFYGIKKINIPKELMDIIIRWEKIKKDYFKDRLIHSFLLLNTTNATSMKYNTLTKYINKIFYPKKISTTLLRKIYLSEKYPVVSTFRQMQEDSYIMGHNIEMAKKIYSKK